MKTPWSILLMVAPLLVACRSSSDDEANFQTFAHQAARVEERLLKDGYVREDQQPAPPEFARTPVDSAYPDAPEGILSRRRADALLPRGQRAVVRMIDQGAEPRARIVYAFPPGSRRLRVQVQESGDTGQNQWPEGTTTYFRGDFARDLLFDVSTKPSDDGDATLITARVVDGLRKSGRGATHPELATGLYFNASYGPTGEELAYEAFTEMGDRVRSNTLADGVLDLLANVVTVSLPEVPVGVGARWQWIDRSRGCTDTLKFVTYELKARTDEATDIEGSSRVLAVGSDHCVGTEDEASYKRYDSSLVFIVRLHPEFPVLETASVHFFGTITKKGGRFFYRQKRRVSEASPEFRFAPADWEEAAQAP